MKFFETSCGESSYTSMIIIEQESRCMATYIVPQKKLGYSNIFLDFLSKNENCNQFYPSQSLIAVANELGEQKFNRDKIADILIKQNKQFGSSEKVFDNIELLRNEKTLVVATGQQAGLFGGSLLIMIKALAIVKSAIQYTDEIGQPVIPIFWIAGDDHDYEEVNHTYVLDRASQIVKTTYDAIPEVELPTAELLFENEDELTNAKTTLKESLGETDFTDELYNLIDTCYTPSENYASAFGKLMARLTADYGLVLFSPGDVQVKKLSIDFFSAIINKQDELHKNLFETNNKIKSLGYHIQVEKKDDSAHLFYNLGGRKPIVRDGDNFKVGEKQFTRPELLKAIADHPEKFSPDVMTRPLWQSALFPVISQKGGAAEIAYLAQIHKNFPLFDLVTPIYKARPTATIVEKRYQTLMEQHKIKFEDLVGDIEDIINRILAESFPDDIEEKFQAMKNHIKCHFEDFSKDSLVFDKSLESFAKQIFGKIDYSLNAFEGKVFSAHKKKSKESRDRIYRLWHSLYPNRTFQERVVNISYFISRYGFKFIPFLYNQIDSEESSHKLIQLSEMES